MMRRPALGDAMRGALTGLLPLFAACGGEGAFPPTEPCITPTATPTRAPAPGGHRDPDGAYRQQMRLGLARLESLSMDFRATWPFERPSSRTDFREAFVVYARDLTCLATDLRALEPATPALGEFDTKFDAAMTKTIDVTEAGRQAVKARNTSRFRDWIREVEALPALYDEVEPLLSQR